METIRLTLSCVNLTRDDLEDLRELHNFVAEMADENVRAYYLRLLEAACAAIESREAARSFLDCTRLEAANEPILYQ